MVEKLTQNLNYLQKIKHSDIMICLLYTLHRHIITSVSHCIVLYRISNITNTTIYHNTSLAHNRCAGSAVTRQFYMPSLL